MENGGEHILMFLIEKSYCWSHTDNESAVGPSSPGLIGTSSLIPTWPPAKTSSLLAPNEATHMRQIVKAH